MEKHLTVMDAEMIDYLCRTMLKTPDVQKNILSGMPLTTLRGATSVRSAAGPSSGRE